MYKTLSRNIHRGKGVDTSGKSRSEARRIIKQQKVREKKRSDFFWKIKYALENRLPLPNIPDWLQKEIHQYPRMVQWVSENMEKEIQKNIRRNLSPKPTSKKNIPSKKLLIRNVVKKTVPEGYARCRRCGAIIKDENLSRHYEKVHSIKNTDIHIEYKNLKK